MHHMKYVCAFVCAEHRFPPDSGSSVENKQKILPPLFFFYNPVIIRLLINRLLIELFGRFIACSLAMQEDMLKELCNCSCYVFILNGFRLLSVKG